MNISALLNDWYVKNKRTLPWRNTSDPYKIWVSEVMLQQTTVRVVIPYYQKFILAFPKVSDLAKASEEEVLSYWSGLGYYSRARNLHRAAKVIVQQRKFPSEFESLLQLPGFGPYTAAAVASIAFGQKVALVDGNVSRVISRLFDIDTDISTTEAKKKINSIAQILIENQTPREHNQAIMELGAVICTPQSPSCLICPVMQLCESRRLGTTHLRPVKNKKKRPENWVWKMYLVKNGQHIGFVKNENGTPWLKNTWVLPGEAKIWKKKKKPSFHFRHTITHHRIFVQLKTRTQSEMKNANLKWVKVSELDQLGISSVVQKAFKHLEMEKN